MLIDTELLKKLVDRGYESKVAFLEDQRDKNIHAFKMIVSLCTRWRECEELIAQIEHLAADMDYAKHDRRCAHGVPTDDGSKCAQCKRIVDGESSKLTP